MFAVCRCIKYISAYLAPSRHRDEHSQLQLCCVVSFRRFPHENEGFSALVLVAPEPDARQANDVRSLVLICFSYICRLINRASVLRRAQTRCLPRLST